MILHPLHFCALAKHHYLHHSYDWLLHPHTLLLRALYNFRSYLLITLLYHDGLIIYNSLASNKTTRDLALHSMAIQK